MWRNFPDALLNLTLWDQLSPQECERLAQYIEGYLPPSFRFVHMATYEVGTQRRHIAHFTWQPPVKQAPVLFSLIPGATTTLGFDQAHPFAVDEELVLDWQDYCLEMQRACVRTSEASARDHHLALQCEILEKAFAHHSEQIEKGPLIPYYEAFYEYLTHMLHPLRTVTLQPFLVEVDVEEANKVLPRPVLTYFRYYHEAIKREVTHINRQGHCSIPQRHVAAFLRQHGFRLLTADEWEYICAAGSRTLFYWERIADEPAMNEDSWMALRNAFGLSMVKDTYQWEYVHDPSLMTGGDGGWAVCGGAGLFAQAITRASAYRLPLNDKRINQGVYGPCFRRAYDLGHVFRRKEAQNGGPSLLELPSH